MNASTGLSLLPGERTTPRYLEHLKEAVNADFNPVKYLSIDPGKANGICGYDAKCYLVFMLAVHADDIMMFLEQFEKVDTCVLEDFTLYPHKAKEQIYSDMETSRVIGRVESWTQRKKVTLVKQGAKIKAVGYAWIGEKPPPRDKTKKRDKMDAHVHFIYWAVRNRLISARDLLKK